MGLFYLSLCHAYYSFRLVVHWIGLILSYAMAISLCLCAMFIISRDPILSSGVLESPDLLLSYPTIYNITNIHLYNNIIYTFTIT